MKTILLLVAFIASLPLYSLPQASSSVVKIITLHSENEKFYLRSVPFDDDFPTTRGRTSVFASNSDVPLYVFERGFDSVDDKSNNLILSNDGNTIFYAIPWEADEEKEGLKSVTVYKQGKLFKEFTESEINKCDKKKERCSLLYSNYDEVIDREKSGTWPNYKKTFKDGVPDTEKFLNDFPIFTSGNTVYLIDSKKKVHLFELDNGTFKTESFESVYDELKIRAKFNKTAFKKIDTTVTLKFPRLVGGGDAREALAKHIGMSTADPLGKDHSRYRVSTFELNSTISRDGSVQVENIEIYDDALPKEKILEFFRTSRFDISYVPAEFDRWYFDAEFFSFRNKDTRIARNERKEQIKKAGEQHAKNMVAETINGIYIPKDMGECFVELDKMLSEINKKEMKEQPDRDGMIEYHFFFGMHLRNSWGLWGGSRLQKYFTERGIDHPDSMSGIILEHYHDWLNGRKETWKEWERAQPVSKRKS